MLLAPRRGVQDWRTAVHDRPNVRDYPTTLTGMMIEQRHAAESMGMGEARIGISWKSCKDCVLS